MLIHPNLHRRGWSLRRAAGFTLVEVIISVLIAAFIFEAVFKGISNSLTLVNLTRENLRATQIIVSRMEGLRLEAWTTNQLFNNGANGFVPATFVDYYYPSGLNNTTNSLGATYYGTMTITTNINMLDKNGNVQSPAPTYSSSMALVTVTLVWTNQSPTYGHGSQYTRTMSTLVSQYGIQNYVILN